MLIWLLEAILAAIRVAETIDVHVLHIMSFYLLAYLQLLLLRW